MRVVISKSKISLLFKKIKQKGYSLKTISELNRVSIRTITDWKRAKFSVPQKNFDKLSKISGLNPNFLNPKIIDDYWYIKKAATKGAYARMRKYGDLGTPEGRRKGGLNSISSHRRLGTNFKTLKPLTKPTKSKKLAEFLGIMFGDGHLSNYQIEVTTNSSTDKNHAFYVKRLTESLFDMKCTISIKSEKKTIIIKTSSKNLVNFINKLGMPIGNKINNNLRMPLWIKQNKTYLKSFIKGLFDTDGCIYCDNHRIKDKTYQHLGWTITTYADKLKNDLLFYLKELGFSPTHTKNQKSIYIRKQKEIDKYFHVIDTSNPKHWKRYRTLIHGRVPKWS